MRYLYNMEIDIPANLNSIIIASGLQALSNDQFFKLLTFYNWCKSTERYVIIATKHLCENPYMLNLNKSFEELYKDIISAYRLYHSNCMLTYKSKNKPNYRY